MRIYNIKRLETDGLLRDIVSTSKVDLAIKAAIDEARRCEEGEVIYVFYQDYTDYSCKKYGYLNPPGVHEKKARPWII